MRKLLWFIVAAVLLAGGATQAQMFDITNPGDPLVGVPNDNNWPAAEAPANTIDNVVTTKYLCFKTSFTPDAATGGSGFRVTPSGPKVVIKALNFASANDYEVRDPIAFRLSGSDESIDGPYTLIAEGTIDAFQTTTYARNTWIPEPVRINNKKAYTHYEVFFTEIRDRAAANSMQIGEVELLSDGSLAGAAGNPAPEDETVDVPRDVVVSWVAGLTAATHDVYFGTSFDDVNDGTEPVESVTDATYDPEGLLEYGQTYYWRIDEVNGAPDYTVFKGDTWSFTVEPFAYPIPNVTAEASSQQPASPPSNSADGTGLDELDQHSVDLKQMWATTAGSLPAWIQYTFDKPYKLHELWVWNSNSELETYMGFGVKDVVIEYSLDGETWTQLENVPEFAKATGLPTYTANTTVDFGGVTAKYLKLTVNTTWGATGIASISEVRFFYVPVQAFGPDPADDATGIDINATLSWRPGREATSHEVYFGADANAVAEGTVASETMTDYHYTTPTMDLETAYYWKVDEVGDTGTYAGDVWSFTTQEFIVVDDFESYTDDVVAETTIWNTWIDGLTNEASGSQVGYDDSPFAEQKIVHSGKQSMPLQYNNTSFAFSEATMTFEDAQDWTASGVKTLAVYFSGAADNSGQLYLKINNTKVAYDGDAANLARGAWQMWSIDLSTVGNVSKVRSLTIGIEGSGATGILYIDDIRLYAKAPEFITPVDPGTANLAALYTLDGNAKDTSGKNNNGTVTGTEIWIDGMIGQAMQFDGSFTYIDCGNDASLNLTGAVTVTAWVRLDVTGGDRKIAGNQDGTTGGYKMGAFTNNKVEFEIRTATNAGTLNRDSSGGTTLQAGVWYHVAGVYSKGEYIRTYVYGSLDRELVTTAVLGSSTGTFKIGRDPIEVNYFWMGALDDIHVYNRVLSQEEILWVMGQTEPVIKPF